MAYLDGITRFLLVEKCRAISQNVRQYRKISKSQKSRNEIFKIDILRLRYFAIFSTNFNVKLISSQDWILYISQNVANKLQSSHREIAFSSQNIALRHLKAIFCDIVTLFISNPYWKSDIWKANIWKFWKCDILRQKSKLR